MDIGDSGGAGKAWIDVNDRSPAALGLHHPLKAHRMALGHIRSLNDNAIGIRQVLLKSGRAASSE
jgi:hypothetical protein